MNVDPKAKLGGVSVVAIRDFLKTTNSRSWSTESLASSLRVGREKALAVVKELVVLEYVERSSEWPGEWWTTTLGLRLGNARATKRYGRAIAGLHLKGFLARVGAANASSDYAYTVVRVLLFGSFLDPASATVGDLDLAVDLAPKSSDHEQQWKLYQARIAAALESGRAFSNFTQQACWPQEEVLRFIKGRSPVITLHPTDEVQAEGWPAKQIFPDEYRLEVASPSLSPSWAIGGAQRHPE